ncbi:hypothetical protein GCM10009584_12410 [Ornithinimicrobium humiphilum]
MVVAVRGQGVAEPPEQPTGVLMVVVMAMAVLMVVLVVMAVPVVGVAAALQLGGHPRRLFA